MRIGDCIAACILPQKTDGRTSDGDGELMVSGVYYRLRHLGGGVGRTFTLGCDSIRSRRGTGGAWLGEFVPQYVACVVAHEFLLVVELLPD